MINGVSRLLINIDKFCDNVPVISTITNLVDLVLKRVFSSTLFKQTAMARSHYVSHIIAKNKEDCIALLIPGIGQCIVHTRNTEKERALLKQVRANPSLLAGKQYQSYTSDLCFMRKAVRTNGLALEFASAECKKDCSLVELAAKNNPFALIYAPRTLSHEKNQSYKYEIVEILLNSTQNAPFDFSKLRALDPDFAYELVRDGSCIQEFDLCNDERAILSAVQHNAFHLQYASEELKNNRSIVIAALSGPNGHPDALQFASKTLKSDPEIIHLAIKKDPNALIHVDEAVLEKLAGTDKVIQTALQAIKTSLLGKDGEPLFQTINTSARKLIQIVGMIDPIAMLKKFPELQESETFIRSAVHRDGLALEFASASLQENAEIVFIAAKNNLQALKWASPKTKEVALITDLIRHYSNDPHALDFLSSEFNTIIRSDNAVGEALYYSCSLEIIEQLHSIKCDLLKNRRFVLNCFRNDPSPSGLSLIHLPPPLYTDEEILHAAIEQNRRVYAKRIEQNKPLSQEQLVACDGEWIESLLANADKEKTSDLIISKYEAIGHVISHLSDTLIENGALAKLLIQKHRNPLFLIRHLRLGNNKKFALSCFGLETCPFNLTHFSDNLRKDHDVVLAAVKKDPNNYLYALHTGDDIVLAAIEQTRSVYAKRINQNMPLSQEQLVACDGEWVENLFASAGYNCGSEKYRLIGAAISHLSNTVIETGALAKLLTRRESISSPLSNLGLTNNKKLALSCFGLETCLFNLTHFSADLRKDHDVVLAAIRKSAVNIQHIMIQDPALMRQAVAINPWVLFFESHFCNNEPFMREMITQNPSILQFVGSELKKSKNFMDEMRALHPAPQTL